LKIFTKKKKRIIRNVAIATIEIKFYVKVLKWFKTEIKIKLNRIKTHNITKTNSACSCSVFVAQIRKLQ